MSCNVLRYIFKICIICIEIEERSSEICPTVRDVVVGLRKDYTYN